MTYQTPPETNPGPARSGFGNVIFFFVVVLIIVGFALLGINSERTASNPPAQTTGQNPRPAPSGK